MAKSLRAAHWQERLHPRDDDGKFARKGGQRWIARVVHQFQASFGDTSMAQPGLRKGDRPRGLIDTAGIRTANAGFNRPVATREASPPGLAASVAKAVAPKPKGTFARGETSATTSAGGAGVAVSSLKKGDHVRVSGVDQYGKKTSLNGYVQSPPGPVTMRKGRTKTPMHSVQVAETPSGAGGWRGTVYTARDAKAEHTAPAADVARLEGAKPDTFAERLSTEVGQRTGLDTPSVEPETQKMTKPIARALTDLADRLEKEYPTSTEKRAHWSGTSEMSTVDALRSLAQRHESGELNKGEVNAAVSRLAINRSNSAYGAELLAGAKAARKLPADGKPRGTFERGPASASSSEPKTKLPTAVPSTAGGQKGAKARKGDLVVVSRTRSDYVIGQGAQQRDEHEFGVVASTDRDGNVKSYYPVGYGDETVSSNAVKLNPLRDKATIGPKDMVDVQAAMAAAKAHHWPGHPGQPKPFDTLAEAAALAKQHRLTPGGKPAAKAPAGPTGAEFAAETRAAIAEVDPRKAFDLPTSARKALDTSRVERQTGGMTTAVGQRDLNPQQVRALRKAVDGDGTLATNPTSLALIRRGLAERQGGHSDGVIVVNDRGRETLKALTGHEVPETPAEAPSEADLRVLRTGLDHPQGGLTGTPAMMAQLRRKGLATNENGLGYDTLTPAGREALGQVSAKPASKIPYTEDTTLRAHVIAYRIAGPPPPEDAPIGERNAWVAAYRNAAYSDEVKQALGDSYRDVYGSGARLRWLQERGLMERTIDSWSIPTAEGMRHVDTTTPRAKPTPKVAETRDTTLTTRRTIPRPETVPGPVSTNPDVPQYSATGTKRGKRTTTVTLPDGTVAKRSSESRDYTHAVVVTTDERARAAGRRQQAERYEAALAALDAWEAAGADPSKLIRKETGRNGRGDRFYGGFLPGFTSSAFQLGDPQGGERFEANDRRPGGTSWELYGPAYVREQWTKQATRLRGEADKLDAGPAQTHGVGRWSSSRDLAEKGRSEFKSPYDTTRVVEVDQPAGGQPITPATLPTDLERRRAQQAAVRAHRTEQGTLAQHGAMVEQHTGELGSVSAVAEAVTRGRASTPTADLPKAVRPAIRAVRRGDNQEAALQAGALTRDDFNGMPLRAQTELLAALDAVGDTRTRDRLTGASVQPVGTGGRQVSMTRDANALAMMAGRKLPGGTTVAGTRPEPRVVKAAPEAPAVPATPRTTTPFDRLLEGEKAVTHKQTRQVIEQMEAHGWKLNTVDQRYGMTTWEAPDGRTLGIQFAGGTTGGKPRMTDVTGQRDLTYKAALAHVVTPKLDEVARPSVAGAMANLGMESLSGATWSDPGRGVRDMSLRPLMNAQSDLMNAKFSYDAAALAADRLRRAAQQNRDNIASTTRGGIPDTRADLWRTRADEFDQVAAELERMVAAHQAYEATVLRRQREPLDIRPGRVPSVTPSPQSRLPKSATVATVEAQTAAVAPDVTDRPAQVRVVSEYASMTRSQFDALPDERKQAALTALRAVAAIDHQEPYTIPSNRTSMGTTIRGMRTPPHIEKARSLVREFTRVIEPPPDNSTAGRVSRLRDAISEGQVRAALAGLTIPQMDELARAAGWGGVSTSWRRDRVVEHFVSRALAGKDTQTTYEQRLLKVEPARLTASLRNENAKTLRSMAIGLGLDPDPDELKAKLVTRIAAEVERRRSGKA